MNRNLFILVLLIIIGSLVFQEVSITGHSIYYQGDSFESGGRTIEIVKISKISAVIGVDSVKNIIKIGEHKNIGGIDIKVIDIFYVEEEESRNVDLSVNVLYTGSCGDGKCEYEENSENCCLDCGCLIDSICEDNKCVFSKPAECKKHEDCDDGDPETTDLCVDLNPKQCKHYKILGEEELEPEIEEKEEVEKFDEKQGFFFRLISFLKNLF